MMSNTENSETVHFASGVPGERNTNLSTLCIKHVCNWFELHLWPWMEAKVIELAMVIYRPLVGLSPQQILMGIA